MSQNLLIFGDSISTFLGYIPEGYAWYYSDTPCIPSDVQRVEDTWWHRLCASCDLTLVRNDSWSGSTVGYTGYDGMCYKSCSFITRLRALNEAGFFRDNRIDQVIVFGATNDSWSDAPIGEYKTEGITEEDLYFVRPAIWHFISTLKGILPQANILFVVNEGLKPEIEDIVRRASEHSGTSYVVLKNIETLNSHPTARGMRASTEQLIPHITNQG